MISVRPHASTRLSVTFGGTDARSFLTNELTGSGSKGEWRLFE
jgi:hypothetical protein